MSNAVALALGQKIVAAVLGKGGTIEQVHALMRDERLFGELVNLVCVLEPQPEKLPVAHFRVSRIGSAPLSLLDVFASVSNDHISEAVWSDRFLSDEPTLHDTEIFFTLRLKLERGAEGGAITPANVAVWAARQGYRCATRDDACLFAEYCQRERVLSYANKCVFVPGSVHQNPRGIEVFPVLRVDETGEAWHLESCRGDIIRQPLVLLVRA